MVVVRKFPVRVILAAFDEKDTLLEIFDTIEHVEDMELDDLYDKMEDCFSIYIQYIYQSIGENSPLYCKCMFIRNRDFQKTWCFFGKGNRMIQPYSNKYMSRIFVYTVEGRIEKIYDND